MKKKLLLLGGFVLLILAFVFFVGKEDSVISPIIRLVAERSGAFFSFCLRVAVLVGDAAVAFALTLIAYVSGLAAKYFAWQGFVELIGMLAVMLKGALIRVLSKKGALTLLSWVLTLRFKARIRRLLRTMRLKIIETVLVQKKVILWWRKQPLWIKALLWLPVLLFVIVGGLLLAVLAGLVGLGNLQYIFPWFGWRLPVAIFTFFWNLLGKVFWFGFNFLLTRFLPGKLVERLGGTALFHTWKRVIPQRHRENVKQRQQKLLRGGRRFVARHRNGALVRASTGGKRLEKAILRLRRIRKKQEESSHIGGKNK